MVDLISNSSNFIIKEVHKDISIQGSSNTGFSISLPTVLLRAFLYALTLSFQAK